MQRSATVALKFTKLTRSGGHTYVQLVESFRDETGRPRQRTISTLGRLDESGGQVDSLLKGLLRAKGDLPPPCRTKVMEQSPLISENSGYETIQIYR